MSAVGSNLGAGTSNSDLKNTYGSQSTCEYGGQKISTGMQFVGCFIGDYVKTAINTSIFTGKTIGVCSMVYGFVTPNVPSFCNYAKTFRPDRDLPAEANDHDSTAHVRTAWSGAAAVRRTIAPRFV